MATKQIPEQVKQALTALISQPRLDYVELKQLFDNHNELGNLSHNGKIIYQKSLSVRCKPIWEDNAKFTEIVNLPRPAVPPHVTLPLTYTTPVTPATKRTLLIEIDNNDEYNKLRGYTASLSNVIVKEVA